MPSTNAMKSEDEIRGIALAQGIIRAHGTVMRDVVRAGCDFVEERTTHMTEWEQKRILTRTSHADPSVSESFVEMLCGKAAYIADRDAEGLRAIAGDQARRPGWIACALLTEITGKVIPDMLRDPRRGSRERGVIDAFSKYLGSCCQAFMRNPAHQSLDDIIPYVQQELTESFTRTLTRMFLSPPVAAKGQRKPAPGM